jgi:hypothetical protein
MFYNIHYYIIFYYNIIIMYVAIYFSQHQINKLNNIEKLKINDF